MICVLYLYFYSQQKVLLCTKPAWHHLRARYGLRQIFMKKRLLDFDIITS